jgi:hypothetical protein
MQGEEATTGLLNFCTFSFDSINPKVVFTAAVVFFNHLLCFKGDRVFIKPFKKAALKKICQIIGD